MKRLLLLAGAGALCTLALFAIYCADVKFDNPLDEKAYKDGDIEQDYRWLWGFEESDCAGLDGIPSSASCVDFIRKCYFGNCGIDDNTKSKWKATLGGCVGDTLWIVREGPQSVTLYYDGANYDRHPIPDSTTAGFQKWMANNKQYYGVVSSNVTDIDVMLTTQGTPETEIKDYGTMPPLGEGGSDKIYIILYRAKKLKCGSTTEWLVPRFADRHVTIKKYTKDDNVLPSIAFNCPTEYTVKLGETKTFNDVGCASPGGGAVLTRTPGTLGVPLDISRPDNYTLTYEACKNLIVGGISKDTCVTRTEIIKVTEQKPDNLPKPVIVLNNYTYTLSDGTFSSPDGVLLNNAPYVEMGVDRAFYLNAAGAEVPIDKSRVTIPNPPRIGSDYATGDGTSITYILEASPAGEYDRTTVTRMVYRIESSCYTSGTPTFTFRTLTGGAISGTDNSLTIRSAEPWSDPKRSIRMGGEVNAYDDVGGGVDTLGNVVLYKLGVDVGGSNLNLYNPKPNTYKVTYVAVSPCPVAGGFRFFRSAERTITVSP